MISRGVVRPCRGSSPLARGTHRRGADHVICHRFIPARAGNTFSLSAARNRRSVHPRSRGEHCRPCVASAVIVGSSPLARGTRALLRAKLAIIRFIPARAGNTMRSARSSARTPVHPRSRGEHRSACPIASSVNGSSPLARGTLVGQHRGPDHRRFIPARAGNTGRTMARTKSATVHPRSRGEHLSGAYVATGLIGSSPLARGTLSGELLADVSDRFIPARAGNTPASGRRPAAAPVHPRSRGEHAAGVPALRSEVGSSPLARGTRGRGRSTPGGPRFIPARAGNTSTWSSPPRNRTVHPRSRGEHRAFRWAGKAEAGSSPLARGTPALESARNKIGRFIPARAGNTPPPGTIDFPAPGSSPLARGTRATSSPHSGSTPVHPRSRGEHEQETARRLPAFGSSPLARGTQRRAHRLVDTVRFIPARAGNTSSASDRRARSPVHPRSRGEHVFPVL